MRTLSDPADALLARTDQLEVHTQHQMALDSAPDFHGSSEDEEALFAGLSGKAPRKVKLPKAAGVKQVKAGRAGAPMVRIAPRQAPRMGGFMPGMGDLDGPAKRPVARVVRRAAPRQAPRMGGFMPGMGDLGAIATAKRMGSAAPRVLSRGVNRSRPVAFARPRSNGGFIPGLGADFSVAGMGIGTLAVVAAGAWFLLRKKG
jgi:hypothetical protein